MKRFPLFLVLLAVLCSANAGASLRSRCRLKPDGGPCEALFTRYFWDKSAQKCKKFVWGGCKGVVPFKTLAECKRARCFNKCRVNVADLLPGPPGCPRLLTSWFFDRKTGKCRSFSYPGCSPIGPFDSLKECKARKCECTLRRRDTRVPPGTVTCAALIRSWFYNKKTKTCRRFTYGGCTAIGFLTKRACLKKCRM